MAGLVLALLNSCTRAGFSFSFTADARRDTAAADRLVGDRVDRLAVDPNLCDLDDRAPSNWTAGCDPDLAVAPCTPTVSASTQFKIGTQSAQFRCEVCGFDSRVSISPAKSPWDLSRQSEFRFWARSTLDHSPYAWQDSSVGPTPWLLLKDANGATLRVEWTAGTTFFNSSINNWLLVTVPLVPTPATKWKTTLTIGFDRSRVSLLELHVDPWDYGFTLWLDGVSFSPACP